MYIRTILTVIVFMGWRITSSFQGAPLTLLLHYPQDNLPTTACIPVFCTSLVAQLKQAKTYVHFAIYGLRKQPEVLQALVEAKERGVEVLGVVDLDEKGQSYYSDTSKLVVQLQSVHSDEKSQLAEAIMHHKFFVIDGEVVWTGSANISDSDTGGYNANAGVLLRSKAVAKWYEHEFQEMYAGRFHKDKSGEVLHTVLPGGIRLSGYHSPHMQAIERAVLEQIGQAEHSIDIAMFYLTHREVADQLVQAHRRGVAVRVILDASSVRNQASKHWLLRREGIPVKVENWGGKMHAKVAVFDAQTIIIGSMNWTLSGTSKNDENTLVLQYAREPARAVTAWFMAVWQTIPDQWLHENPGAESVSSGFSCRDAVDNDYDNKVDQEDSECSGAAQKGPPLQVKEGEGTDYEAL